MIKVNLFVFYVGILALCSWSSPPQSYHRFVIFNPCGPRTGITCDVLQLTYSLTYKETNQTGIKLTGCSIIDQNIKIAPIPASDFQILVNNNLPAYKIVFRNQMVQFMPQFLLWLEIFRVAQMVGAKGVATM